MQEKHEIALTPTSGCDAVHIKKEDIVIKNTLQNGTVQSAISYVNEDLTIALALISTIDYYAEKLAYSFCCAVNNCFVSLLDFTIT